MAGLFPGMAWRCEAARSPSRVHSQLLRGFLGCAGSALSAEARSIWGQKGHGIPAHLGLRIGVFVLPVTCLA